MTKKEINPQRDSDQPFAYIYFLHILIIKPITASTVPRSKHNFESLFTSRKGQKINGISQSAPLTFGLRMNAHTFARVAHLHQNPKPDFPNIFCVLSLVGNSKWAPTAPVLDAPLRPSCGQPCPNGPSPPSNPHQTHPQNVFLTPHQNIFSTQHRTLLHQVLLLELFFSNHLSNYTKCTWHVRSDPIMDVIQNF